MEWRREKDNAEAQRTLRFRRDEGNTVRRLGFRRGEKPKSTARNGCATWGCLKFEEFAEAFGLLAGDGDFGGFLVVHFEHEAGFEPGDNFLDVVDIDEIGAVGAPEGVGVEGGVEFLEGAVVGRAFEILGGDGDEAAFDGSEDEVFGVHQKHALLRANEDFGRLRGGGLGSGELGNELFESLGGTGLRFDFAFGFLDGFGDAGLVEGLQNVIHGVYVEGLDRVVVEGGGEDDVGDLEFAFDEFLEDAKAVEAGHLDVEEDEVWRVLLDEIDGFEAVFTLADKGDFGKGFEEEGEFLAGGFLVVDDDGVDGHWGRESIARGERKWRGRAGINTEGTEIGGEEGTEKRMQVVQGRGVVFIEEHRQECLCHNAGGAAWDRGAVFIEEHRQECLCHNAKKAA